MVTGGNLVPVGKRKAHKPVTKPYIRRRGRWAPESEKVVMPGMPTLLPSVLTEEQVDAYILTLRIEEISKKIRNEEPPPDDWGREDEPEPIYQGGIQINSREIRYRDMLEKERMRLIDDGIKKLPTFKPPTEFKPRNKYQGMFFWFGFYV
jgi:splicing factor 1